MLFRQEDPHEADPGLPSADDFSFEGIMKAVEPEGMSLFLFRPTGDTVWWTATHWTTC